ncbi:hypothetical protein FB389_0447 [Rarobacter incanus]|uniref:Uncharacterized protein n=1 Tax=Rarobacter incanus TaxID=153494 RepID=A0A542SMG1_9MICO|nr:hypothetical protein FB389_0447 [Rarobacter incanus]
MRGIIRLEEPGHQQPGTAPSCECGGESDSKPGRVQIRAGLRRAAGGTCWAGGPDSTCGTPVAA